MSDEIMSATTPAPAETGAAEGTGASTSKADWNHLGSDVQYLIFKELAYLDSVHNKRDWKDIASLMLVSRSWNEGMRYSLSMCGPLMKVLDLAPEDIAKAALKRALKRLEVDGGNGDDSGFLTPEDADFRSLRYAAGDLGFEQADFEISAINGRVTMRLASLWLVLALGREFIDCSELLFNAGVPRTARLVHAAVLSGNPKVLDLVLKQDLCEPAVEIWGESLATAISDGPLEMVDALLLRSAPTDYGVYLDNAGIDYQPLNYAVLVGKVELFNILLRHIDPNDQVDDIDLTPLALAVRQDNVYMVKRLIEEGARLDPLVPADVFPLGEAIKTRNTKMVDLLLENGATLTYRCFDRLSALDYAIRHDDDSLEFVSKLIGLKSAITGTSFSEAVARQSHECIELLFGNMEFARPNAAAYGLYSAAENGLIEFVKQFLDHRVVMVTNGPRPIDSLRVAVQRQHTEVVRVLLIHGADPNSLGSYHESILYLAVCRSNEEIVRVLLEYGADPDLSGCLTCLTLQKAVDTQHEGIVALLLAYGANVLLPGGPNGSAINTAILVKSRPLLRMLLKAAIRDVEGDGSERREQQNDDFVHDLVG
ncbi:hypothetical protein AJ80_04846 [Polytolypa hystricis UAMH7299]|uniref:Uncharacterized protein n=1 Tax=Polytolypa hystricis (strain UAMH7299) TaxID=1447883 RepID=A0A2B7Y865_POLH7|nr:hypothetical protein AJ80_04846 [Polytolypa hystricis UAMH7299]